MVATPSDILHLPCESTIRGLCKACAGAAAALPRHCDCIISHHQSKSSPLAGESSQGWRVEGLAAYGIGPKDRGLQLLTAPFCPQCRSQLNTTLSLPERLAPSALTHPTLHPYDTKQQAKPQSSVYGCPASVLHSLGNCNQLE